jgi:hypothetical protein
VSPQYLYALLDAEPAGPIGVGLAGEPLRIVACDGLFAATGDIAETPGATPEALRGHDAVVRRLAALAHAILPARFGMLTRDDADLCARLTHGSALREALARVAGREQMTLRVYSASAAGPEETHTSPPAGSTPGAAYLAERARRLRLTTDIAELMPLRDALARFVIEERVERHETPPLVASAYHLIARGRAEEYTNAVEAVARGVAGVRIRVSGPWAPYAFAPDVP